jgi:enoyl-[acyl-carrier protein] reductase III
MSTAMAPATLTDLTQEVREIFAQVTRYPLEILDPGASLEEDLGIDSVKVGEVFGVLSERFNLSDKLVIPRESIKNIGSIAESLREYLKQNTSYPPPTVVAPPQASAPAPHVVAPPAEPVKPAPATISLPKNGASSVKDPVKDLDQSVRAVFAEVTRYPLDILDPSAGLEEDLGIDSVKLGEVFAVLRERYNLPEDMEIPRESLKTIGAVTDALRSYVAAPAPATVTAPAAPAPLAPPISKAASDILDNSFASLTPERRPFEGKIALVTGSGHGLGKDIAIYLGGLGATVIVNSFHSKDLGEQTTEEIKAAGGKAVHIWGSVATPQHRDAIFNEIDKQFGALDFFIANASNGMLAKLEDITTEHWEKAFRTNVIGLHQCSLRAVELMKRRGGGKIITLSSPAANGYVDYFGCMAAVKAAVESLTKTMAIEFAKYNVQINCVSPGPIYGDLLNKWPESKRLIASWERATVFPRLCVDRDVSHFIAYLLSDAVKLFTGSVLVIDGGISVWVGGVSGEVGEHSNGTPRAANGQPLASLAHHSTSN